MGEDLALETRLEAALRTLAIVDPDVRVYPSDHTGFKYFGSVTSPSFESMNEAERQSLVWGRILDRFSDEEQRQIEFVYTHAPSERLVVSQ